MAEIHNWHALLPLIVQFSDIFDSVVFDKMLPHKLRGEQSQCQNIECFAKPWLIFTFLVFFARFAIFVKIDTLQRRIFTKPMPIVCCAGFDIFVTLPYLPFLSKSPIFKGPLSTSHKTFRHIFGDILPYSPFLSKSLLLKGPLSTAR